MRLSDEEEANRQRLIGEVEAAPVPEWRAEDQYPLSREGLDSLLNDNDDECLNCKRLEAERDRLQQQCEWMRENMCLYSCPPGKYSHDCTNDCAGCEDAYLATEPWKEEAPHA